MHTQSVLFDSGCSLSIAPDNEFVHNLLKDLRDANANFTLGDAATKVKARKKGDIQLEHQKKRDGDVSITFHCLQTGKMWLLSVDDLTDHGYLILLRNWGTSYGITPNEDVFIILREKPANDGSGGGSGLWRVVLQFTEAGVAQIQSLPRDSPEAIQVLNSSILDMFSKRSGSNIASSIGGSIIAQTATAPTGSTPPATTGSTTPARAGSTTPAPTNPTTPASTNSITPAPTDSATTAQTGSTAPTPRRNHGTQARARPMMTSGHNGRLLIHDFHSAMGHCGETTSYAFAYSGSLGLPIEFTDVTSAKSKAIIICGSGCDGCRSLRHGVHHHSPTADAVFFGVSLTGTHWLFDFTRVMPVADFQGNTMSACFFERKVGYRIIYNVKSHHEIFACSRHLISRAAREIGVKIRTITLDSDTTVFKTGSLDPYTEEATKFMDETGTLFRASPPNTQALNLAEGFMNYLMAVTFSQIAHARLCMRFWGLSILHAADVLNVRPHARDDDSTLPFGACSWSLYWSKPADLSLFLVWGSMAKLKIVGTKSNQLKRQHRDGLFVGIAWHCLAWRFFVIEDQSLTVTWHANINSDMTARSSLLYRDGLAMGQNEGDTALGTRLPPNVHNQLIRDLYAELPNGIHEGIVVSDRLTGVPVTMVPSYDQRGDLVMVETREMPAPPTPVVPTTAPSSTAPAAAPTAVTTPRSTRPPPRPSNRPSAVPPKDTVDRLHALGDDVAIRFVQPCPKRPGTASFKRYEAYMSCTTLGELRKMWPKRAFKADYAFDYHHGYLTFENPATLAFVGSIWSELLLPANDFFRRTEQQQDVTEERVTAVTATTIAANTNRDEIDYFDGGWDWSQHDAETRRQLSINKWGGGEPDGYITNYLSYAEDVEHEMKTADTVDDTSTMDTAYISAMLGSLGSIGEPALPVPPPGYIGTWEEYMNEVCTYDDDLDINVDDTSKNRENLELAAARIITDITGAGTEEYHEEESLINAVADSLDKRLEMLGTDAPEPEKVEEFIAAAFAGRDPEYACSATSAETDPTFPEAISSPKRKEWIEACLTEWVSLTTTYKCFGTNVRPMREAVERTRRGERVRIIPLRWVLKMKPSRLKARLVACESVGRYNTPRLDKWSPTIGSDSVRMVFVIGCQHNCDFFSLDISGAYLTGKRPADEPDVYLTMPPGLDLIREYAEEHGIDLGEAKSLLNYKDANGKPNCLFLEGNLYGTQLAGRAFWEHARNWLVNDLGFKDATGDPCIFVKWMDDGSFIIVGLYVDDCLIATTSPETRRWFEQAFQDEFSQSPDSDGDTYLGIEYKVHELGNYKYVTLNTPRIWEKLRDKLDGLQITLPKVSTPLPSNAMDLVYADVDEVNNPLVKESEINVREILGMLSWGVHAVRPGEAFASSLIARRAHLPTRSLVVVLLHLTSYLLDHADDKLHITGNGERIFTTACDSSFANDQGHHGSGRSWFGFALIWGGIAFHFRSKLQPYVAPSTRDAEAGALVFCVKAMIGTLVMLEELGFLPEGVTPLRLEIDSQAAIASMTTEWIHKDSRWNAIRIRFLREFVREMLIKPFYTVTTEMRADTLTKVPSSAHSHAIARLALMGTAPPPYSK